MYRIIYPALRWLGWSAILLYIVVAVAVLGTRYVVFPKAQHYKPYIEAQLSTLLGSRVELGHVSAQWQRLNPRIEMDQITLYDSRNAQVLSVPHLAAVVSWRSLFTGSAQFVSVHAGGVDVSVRRDVQQRLWLLGRAVSDVRAQPADSTATGALGDSTVQWLVSQPQIQLHDSTIRWIDESRNAQALVLHDVSLKVRNREQRHQFSLTARPEAAVGGNFDMRGNLTRSPDRTRPLALETGHGQLYVHIDDMRPDAWQPWVDWPDFLHSDRVSVRTWLEVRQGEPLSVIADMDVDDAQWTGPGTQAVQSRSAHLYVKGPWQGFQNMLKSAGAEGADSEQLDFGLQAQDLRFLVPDLYEQPVVVNTVGTRGTIKRDRGALALQLHDVTLSNDDIAFTGALNWAAGTGGAGSYVDASAQVRRASLAGVHRYIPRMLSTEVREWLEEGLLAGQVYDASVVLRGDLSAFPFDALDADGEFRISGPYRDAVIDYIPPDEDTAGWPRLDAVQGWIDLNRASLRIHAEKAQIRPASGLQIDLDGVDAYIDNLDDDDPVLTASGATQGDGAAYMAFLQQPALSGMLDHVFDQASAQGAWKLPLALTIPLDRPTDTAVKGTIQLSGGYIQFEPELPRFDDVSGDIEFTEDDVRVTSLSARFLNEKVQLSGGAGPGQPGLRMTGHLDAQTLSTIFDVPGMARFKGKSAYVATLSGKGMGQDAQPLTLGIRSDLQGMAMDFPPPLNKAADTAWPLDITWSQGDQADTRWLDISLNGSMHGRFVHRGQQSSQAYFQSGSLGVGRAAQWFDDGINVDIAHPVFDGDAWDAISREFITPENQADRGPIFPEVRALRVQTTRGRLLGLPLDELTYTVKHLADTEWRADISSTQTAGTLSWNQENGTVQGPVHAVFHRLAYGDDFKENEVDSSDAGTDDASDDHPVDDDLRIPAINLIIENLSLYGRDVGKLALVGVNEDRGDTWRLEQLTLSSPSAHLEGRGVWRLRGPGRGLTLDADVDVSDLGDYFDQIGFKDVLSGGEGRVHAKIDWHDLPWSFDISKIDGELDFEFTKGRLSTVNSKSARLLELISLQSVRRLATLDVNPLTLTHHGFPYDVLRGVLRLEHGQVHTDDYRIIGPVGTVVLEGLVHLATGKLDLQAVVIPNLDVSGAAIAAGVAINPVVGLGAFLTQWLLKAPLAAAMTVQYKIDGDWDQPEIQTVERFRGHAEGQTDP